MCGIFGIISPSKNGLTKAEEDFIETMLVVDALRGAHGVGTYWVGNKDTGLTDWLKIAGDPYNLFYSKEWAPYWNKAKAQSVAFVGHHRYATKGARTNDNTHPFKKGPITLVHNGTIHWGLSKYDKNVDVDSEALTIGISKEGPSILSDISGAFACVWHNADEHTMNIACNGERPFSLFKVGTRYMFASEANMLLFALNRADHKLVPERVDLKIDHLYKFNLDELGDPEVSPLPAKKYHYQKHGGGISNQQKKLPAPVIPIKRSSDQDCIFTIRKKQLVVLAENNASYWTYLGISDRAEAVYFNSPREFGVNEKVEYYGEIVSGETGTYEAPWATEKTIWYKLKTGSVKLCDLGAYPKNVGPTVKIQDKYYDVDKIDEGLRENCVSCGEYIPTETLHDCSVFTINMKRELRIMCKDCTDAMKELH